MNFIPRYFDEEDDKKYLRISVEDTGTGIKKEDQNKLFKLFGYVNDASGLNTHGIGLGLVISEKIVKQFGGKIQMKSVHEKGSQFSFTMKLFEKNHNKIYKKLTESCQYKCDNGELMFKFNQGNNNMNEIKYKYKPNQNNEEEEKQPANMQNHELRLMPSQMIFDEN